jgi:hypothetical protein
LAFIESPFCKSSDFIRDLHFGLSASESLHPSASFGAVERRFFLHWKASTPSTLQCCPKQDRVALMSGETKGLEH